VFSRFFIDRPIFASVLSILITLCGGIALLNMPLAQFPHISPPIVQVDCNYPGANAEVVAATVAAPIEQQVNGVEGMMYMASQCTNDGSYNLTVTFKHGVNLNMALVLVQNRLNLALPTLPDVLKRTGVVAKKKSPDILMSVNLHCVDNRYDQLYLSNYALLHVKDELARVPGVSDVYMSGERDYSMRIWVDPGKLSARGLTAGDIANAIRDQNTSVATGHLGQKPTTPGRQFEYPLDTLGRLSDVAQFESIVLKAFPDGRCLHLRDVAHVEMGAKSQDVSCHLDGRPSVGLAIFQLPDANALECAELVHAKIHELEQDFPPGIVQEIQYDSTPYTRECISEVVKTLRDSVILVAVVVLVFLGNWRSALIPLIAVPVAIIGTFVVMLPLGFTLNTQTLFGLVLAIGIVVDDAIVVVEAVEHHIEHGMSPRQAAIRAMEQVSGPVIAVGLVLSAVFLPCAFVGGITGQFFRQFALTIAVSTIISAFNSLTLSPALAALLLRPRPSAQARTQEEETILEPLPRLTFALAGGWLGWRFLAPALTAAFARWLGMDLSRSPFLPIALSTSLGAAGGWAMGKPLNRLMVGFFGLFNRAVQICTRGYVWSVGKLLRVSVVVLLVYGGLLYLTYWQFRRMPTGFIPPQDRGFLQINVQLPDSASMERTQRVMLQVDDILLHTPGVKHTLSSTGQSQVLGAFGSNFGSNFVLLNDFDDRRSPDLTAEAIAAGLRHRLSAEVPDAVISVFTPAPIRGVGRTGGFKIMVEDRGDLGPQTLQAVSNGMVEGAEHQPGLVGLYNVFRANTPQLYFDLDRAECMSRNVPLQDAFDALGIHLGSLYVNDFNRFGRTWQVIIQAEGQYRDQPEQVRQLKVRNKKGGMVPLGALGKIREVNGPLILTRYNMYPAAAISGSTAPDVSSGQAVEMMEELAARELPPSMTFEWTEMAYLEIQAGNTAMVLFALSVVMVFLVLAAQYESWSLPLAVILVVPMGLFSAILGVAFSHMDINIFTRIGFVVLVGLASKNAILIVQFAKEQREAGVSRRQATLEACRLRLRPILMTSFAFILGVMPLVVATGAGAEMRRPLGTTVFWGMLGVTLFGIFLTPVFFYLVNRMGDSWPLNTPGVRRAASLPLQMFNLLMPWRFFRTPRSRQNNHPFD
jgi:multidrug efflux pump